MRGAAWGIAPGTEGTRSLLIMARAAAVSPVSALTPAVFWMMSAAPIALRAILDCRPPFGDLEGDLLPRGGGLGAAELLDEHSGIDRHRARDGAGPIHCAGFDAVVLVFGLQLREQRGALGLAGHLTAQHDPLPGRGGHVTAGADGLAEPALDAVGGDVLDGEST